MHAFRGKFLERRRATASNIGCSPDRSSVASKVTKTPRSITCVPSQKFRDLPSKSLNLSYKKLKLFWKFPYHRLNKRAHRDLIKNLDLIKKSPKCHLKIKRVQNKPANPVTREESLNHIQSLVKKISMRVQQRKRDSFNFSLKFTKRKSESRNFLNSSNMTSKSRSKRRKKSVKTKYSLSSDVSNGELDYPQLYCRAFDSLKKDLNMKKEIGTDFLMSPPRNKSSLYHSQKWCVNCANENPLLLSHIGS
ncbi:unnamed protein product [Moneuplotes crassus]|uniref:Uncharacterized protein n=1 Tax=Euplotes crassus TaxID=5936 RepID=A0AAD1XRJ5_EUPCR|nr:unnamed protein product [Moneuplotes crassus]